MTIKISRAAPSEVPDMAGCTLRFAQESGPHWVRLFDQSHAERHMRNLVLNGVCYIAKKGSAVIGMIACARIDVGFAYLPDLETAHIYVIPEERTFGIATELFKAVEAHALEHRLKVLFHQANYPAVIDGNGANGDRVEALFKRRRYEGPIDVVYAAPDFVRVGMAYLFDAARARKDVKSDG